MAESVNRNVLFALIGGLLAEGCWLQLWDRLCRTKRETDFQLQTALLTFAIVGAGPTGVELAGSIVELARDTLPPDFRRIDTRRARVVLIEAGLRVLPGYPEDLSAYAQRALEGLGVEVVLGNAVTECTAGGVVYGDRSLEAKTVIWAAGVRASAAAKWVGGRRHVVEKEHEVFYASNIFLSDATASRHTFIAAARKARCVLAEIRWRWTLKVLCGCVS
jgi:NADH dehydrogenase FAD-containing subunit